VNIIRFIKEKILFTEVYMYVFCDWDRNLQDNCTKEYFIKQVVCLHNELISFKIVSQKKGLFI